MDVHVPKPGNEKTAVGINDAALRRLSGIEPSDRNDAIALESDGLIRQVFAGGDVHNGDMDDGSDFWRLRLRNKRASRCEG